MERMPFMEGVFRRVENAARVENFSGNERRQYERDLKVYRDYRNQMAGARLEGRTEGMAQGRAEGKAEGRAEGRAEGLAIGEEKGALKERNANIRKLVDAGFTPETVSSVLGIPLDEVNAITKAN